MKRFLVFLTLLTGIFFVSSIEMKIGKDEKVTFSENLSTDYLFMGESLEFNGSTKDLFFFGKSLQFNGNTESSLFGFGEDLELQGVIGNDIISATDNLTISGNVNGTVFAASNILTVSKESVIDGSIFAAGKKVIIDGIVNGDVYCASGRLIVNGIINGDVKLATGMVNINETGMVNGNFHYYSKDTITESETSRITGEVVFKEKSLSHSKTSFKKGMFVVAKIFSLFILLSFVIAGMLLLLLPFMKNVKVSTPKEFFEAFIWGLIPFFIYPVAVVVLFSLVITIPLAFVLLLAALPLLFFTQVVGVTLFGEMLFKVFKWNEKSRFIYFLFGLIFYVFLSVIPFISQLSVVFFSSAGWGKIVKSIADNK